MRVNSILETIGNTPHVRLNRLYNDVAPGAEVWLKLERNNPGGSIKDRIGLAMVDDAERRGILAKGSTIVEPTSGNTGIGLAMAAAVKGYRCILVMPDSMSVERRRILVAQHQATDSSTSGVRSGGAPVIAGADCHDFGKAEFPGHRDGNRIGTVLP